MLEIIILLGVAALLSTIPIWFYRTVSSWRGFSQRTHGNVRMKKPMGLQSQQGYIDLGSPKRRKKARVDARVNVHYSSSKVKKPWGW